MNPLLASPYGDTAAIMPHLDRMADEGAVFEHAYCNNPLCTPSRASMMTGRLIADIECAFDNGSVLNSEIPTLAHMLNRAGYRTVLSGKMHYIGADQLHGFQERLTTDIYPADLAWSPDGFDLAEPTHTSYSKMIYARCGISEANMQLDYDESVHAHAVLKLKELAQDDTPFMLTVSYTHPHSPFEVPEKYFRMYDDRDIELPHVPDSYPAFLDEYNQFLCADFGYKGRLDDDLMRTIKQSYYGMYTYVNDKLGELAEALSASPQADNTVVIFTSDHGEMMGRKGMFEKRTYFEDVVRVPLVMWYPSRFKPGRVTSPVSLLDLFPTLADLAESDWPLDTVGGRSLVPAAEGDTTALDNGAIVTEYYGESIKYPFRAVVKGRLKYVHFPTCPDKDLLFDLDKDPHEEAPATDDPAYADQKKELQRVVKEGFDYSRLKPVIDRSHADRALVKSTYPSFQPKWDFDPGDGTAGDYARTKIEE